MRLFAVKMKYLANIMPLLLADFVQDPSHAAQPAVTVHCRAGLAVALGRISKSWLLWRFPLALGAAAPPLCSMSNHQWGRSWLNLSGEADTACIAPLQ